MTSHPIPDSLPSDIAQTPPFPPIRPVNIKFPTTAYGMYRRSFNPIWYERFHWLEYSVMNDACFCYPAECLALPMTAPVEDLDQNQCLH